MPDDTFCTVRLFCCNRIADCKTMQTAQLVDIFHKLLLAKSGDKTQNKIWHKFYIRGIFAKCTDFRPKITQLWQKCSVIDKCNRF